MPARYLVNLGDAQVYVDASLRRCKPPGSNGDVPLKTIHFVQMGQGGELLTKSWDISLAGFSAEQRERGKLYRKSEG